MSTELSYDYLLRNIDNDDCTDLYRVKATGMLVVPTEIGLDGKGGWAVKDECGQWHYPAELEVV